MCWVSCVCCGWWVWWVWRGEQGTADPRVVRRLQELAEERDNALVQVLEPHIFSQKKKKKREAFNAERSLGRRQPETIRREEGGTGQMPWLSRWPLSQQILSVSAPALVGVPLAPLRCSAAGDDAAAGGGRGVPRPCFD